MAVELAPDDAAETGERLTVTAGYLLIGEVLRDATYEEDENDT